MSYKLMACAALSLGLSIITPTTQAAAPAVAVDIAPVHSLVSQVMAGVAQPKLLIPAAASPHRYALRPSEAKALSRADIVFWMGESYTPWLEKALDNVADSAHKVEMLALEGTLSYGYREGATFEAHHHDEHKKQDSHQEALHQDRKERLAHSDNHREAGHKEKAHKEKVHKEENHGDKDAHESDHHDHHHDGNDPHAWLDPENAKRWLQHISEVLSQRDPQHAAVYRRNAQQAQAELDRLMAATQGQIDALGQPRFIVFHDAYQYFEKRFGISAAGAISLGDAEDPSPARIREIRATVKKWGVNCVFTEPQYNPQLVRTIFPDGGKQGVVIGVMDPLGATIATGSGHYKALIEAMVTSLSQCQSAQ